MYTEIDKDGKIIIQAIKKEEAELLVWCICSYFANKQLQNRTKEEKEIIKLKKELEKLY